MRHEVKKIRITNRRALLIVSMSLMLLLPEGFSMNQESEKRNANIFASENMMCGPNCLAVYCLSKGIDTLPTELALLAGTDSLGTTMKGLLHAAETKGIHALGVEISDHRMLKDLPYAAILSVSKSVNVDVAHFILLMGFRNDHAKIVDPPHNPYLLHIDDLGALFRDTAILLSEDPIDLEAFEENKIKPDNLSAYRLFVVCLIGVSVFFVGTLVRKRYFCVHG